MHFYKEERGALFIDGYSLYAIQKDGGLEIDYNKLLKVFREKLVLKKAIYFAYAIENGEEYIHVKPLIDWLSYNGYSTKVLVRKQSADSGFLRRYHFAILIDIAVTAMEMIDYFDHAIFITAPEELVPLTEALMSNGKRVTVIGSLETETKTSDALRRSVTQFVDIYHLPEIMRRGSSVSRGDKQFPRNPRNIDLDPDENSEQSSS